ncbi:MAG: hypothetical protein ILP10_06465 [Lachnospiraceae bacterium]|nr:hypothetical protein [Lachnospiraceae bacterium]
MKMSDLFKKLVTLAVCAVMIFSLSGGYVAKADTEGTVRVYDIETLDKAIASSDVSTIIFRTLAYIDVTIAANDAAKGKKLVIDAENASFTNKAKFKSIEIQCAYAYTESVSGNEITIAGPIFKDNRIVVSAKKKVKKLTLYSEYGEFFKTWTLRKNAKIKSFEYIYANGTVLKSDFDKKNKKISINFTNPYDCKIAFTALFDKNGRVLRITSESDGAEFCYDYKYTYDNAGNITKVKGYENESGGFVSTYKYVKNRLKKSVHDSFTHQVTQYSYNKKGLLTKEKFKSTDSIDGITFYVTSTVKNTYDKNGRKKTVEMTETTEYENEEYPTGTIASKTENTYDEKGFNTKVVRTQEYGGETKRYTYTYEYNAAGDMTRSARTEWDSKTGKETEYEPEEYTYDDLGEPVDWRKP